MTNIPHLVGNLDILVLDLDAASKICFEEIDRFQKVNFAKFIPNFEIFHGLQFFVR